MPLPALIPIAKVAAPFILKGVGALFGNRGKKKQLKEQQRAAQADIDAKYQSDVNRFDNAESDRLMRTQGIAQQLKGARALSPEVIAAAMQKRKNTAYKTSVADMTKGMGSQLIGQGLNAAGDIAGAMLKERAIAQAERGGGGGGILQAASQLQPTCVGQNCPEGD